MKCRLEDRIKQLHETQAHYIKHIQICLEQKDWHGIEDAASDIRDVESAIDALKWCEEMICNKPEKGRE